MNQKRLKNLVVLLFGIVVGVVYYQLVKSLPTSQSSLLCMVMWAWLLYMWRKELKNFLVLMLVTYRFTKDLRKAIKRIDNSDIPAIVLTTTLTRVKK